MTFLLDTNVVSALRRPERADPNLLIWAAGVPTSQFFISAITLFEIEVGILRLQRKDELQSRRLRIWIGKDVLIRFAGRILPFDAIIARRRAALHVPDPASEHDSFIAATALVHGMTVVTRNVRDFEGLGVPLLDPWEAGAA